MKHIVSPLWFVAVAMVAPCLAAPAPASLNGKTVVLNYTQAQYKAMDSGWQSFKAAKKNVRGCADLFINMGLSPKATRTLLPITTPAQGGKYTYSKTGANTGNIACEIDGAFRNIEITFTSATTGIATESLFIGHLTSNGIRNIQVTIK